MINSLQAFGWSKTVNGTINYIDFSTKKKEEFINTGQVYMHVSMIPLKLQLFARKSWMINFLYLNQSKLVDFTPNVALDVQDQPKKQ